MNMVSQMFSGFLAGLGPFLLLLGLLIFVHELGHFLVAKWCGVRVDVFSLGFGKKILKYKWGDTTYCVSIIPLGGYVKMFGDDPSVELPENERARAFLYQPVLKRIAIVLAGPLMNLFFAAVLFMMVARVGEEVPKAQVGDVAPKSVAYLDGFRSGDEILSINGQKTTNWLQVKKAVNDSFDQTLKFEVQRGNETKTLTATPALGPNDNIFSFHSQVGHIDGLSLEARATVIGIPSSKSPAARAGMKTLDVISSINGHEVHFWRELEPLIEKQIQDGTKTLTFKFRPADAKDPKTAAQTADISVAALTKADGTDGWLKSLGMESSELYILKLKPGGPADKAGIKANDKILKINGVAMAGWTDVLSAVKSYKSGGGPLTFTLLQDGKTADIKVSPEMTELTNIKGQEEHRFTIGIVSAFMKIGPDTVLSKTTNPIEVFTRGVEESLRWTGYVAMSLVRLVQGEVSARNLGGVITIGRVASHSFYAGFSAFLRTMAIISINLFLLNLLPIPVLDGGHLVFFSVEVIKGSPLSLKKMEIAQQVGLTLLMLFMVFALFNDITNLFSSHW